MFRWLRREPQQLVERRKVLSPALADYPPYRPPHRQGPFLRRRDDQAEEDYTRYSHEYAARSDENFAYFMGQRTARLAALQSFLNKFGVSASLDDAGLASVSAWFSDNGFALANLREPAVSQAFYQMQTPWTEGLLGLNVVFDLGIFLGDLLIQKQPNLHWTYVRGLSDDGDSSSTGYKIEGFRRKAKVNRLSPADYVLGCCWNDLNELYSYAPRPSALRDRDIFVGLVRAYAAR
ncbi:hypothetical protein [Bradyrhizobium sp. P5_C12]